MLASRHQRHAMGPGHARDLADELASIDIEHADAGAPTDISSASFRIDLDVVRNPGGHHRLQELVFSGCWRLGQSRVGDGNCQDNMSTKRSAYHAKPPK